MGKKQIRRLDGQQKKRSCQIQFGVECDEKTLDSIVDLFEDAGVDVGGSTKSLGFDCTPLKTKEIMKSLNPLLHCGDKLVIDGPGLCTHHKMTTNGWELITIIRKRNW